MQGQMMHRPLRVIDILSYAAEVYNTAEVVSVRVEGDMHRYTYRDALARVTQLASGLEKLGVQMGDRVATLAWNGYRHFELYYAVAGIGAVCHTINPRLSAEQMIYIVNHAGDRVFFTDLTFVPALEKLAAHFPKDITFVIMTDRDHMPETTLNAHCYEEVLATGAPDYTFPDFDENTACALCYTSVTTGNPMGALYSHRSTV
ncbi:MAG: AMP-binding protein, partial [Pseudomonadota bacterium]